MCFQMSSASFGEFLRKEQDVTESESLNFGQKIVDSFWRISDDVATKKTQTEP